MDENHQSTREYKDLNTSTHESRQKLDRRISLNVLDNFACIFSLKIQEGGLVPLKCHKRIWEAWLMATSRENILSNQEKK